MSNKKRSFTIHQSSISEKGGRYKSDTPISVANKVAQDLFDKHPRTKKLSFCIRETTKNSKKRLYYYIADKKKVRRVKKHKGGGGGFSRPKVSVEEFEKQVQTPSIQAIPSDYLFSDSMFTNYVTIVDAKFNITYIPANTIIVFHYDETPFCMKFEKKYNAIKETINIFDVNDILYTLVYFNERLCLKKGDEFIFSKLTIQKIYLIFKDKDSKRYHKNIMDKEGIITSYYETWHAYYYSFKLLNIYTESLFDGCLYIKNTNIWENLLNSTINPTDYIGIYDVKYNLIIFQINQIKMVKYDSSYIYIINLINIYNNNEFRLKCYNNNSYYLYDKNNINFTVQVTPIHKYIKKTILQVDELQEPIQTKFGKTLKNTELNLRDIIDIKEDDSETTINNISVEYTKFHLTLSDKYNSMIQNLIEQFKIVPEDIKQLYSKYYIILKGKIYKINLFKLYRGQDLQKFEINDETNQSFNVDVIHHKNIYYIVFDDVFAQINHINIYSLESNIVLRQLPSMRLTNR